MKSFVGILTLAFVAFVKADGTCFEDGVRYPGNDIGKPRTASSPEDCQKACFDQSECVIWTYNKSKNKRNCYLKTAKGNEKVEPISGSKTCKEDSCLEVGVGYTKNNIKDGFEVKSDQDCQTACETEAKCKVWTFNKANRKCFIKSSRGGKVEAVSGPKECPAPAPAVGSKMMIINGTPNQDGQNVEIIDLNDKDFSCDNFPKTKVMYSGVAGLVENTIMWCGGEDGGRGTKHKQCKKLDLEEEKWKDAVDLEEAKGDFGKGSIIVDGKLLVSGGDNGDNTVNTIELVSLNSKTIATLPFPLRSHCNIQIDETHVMITGGASNKKETFIQNLANGDITKGVDMNVGRQAHACTKFQWNGINYAIVLGGDSETSVEVLNLDQKDAKWKKLNKFANYATSSSYMVTHLNNVYLFGGNSKHEGKLNDIMKMECKDNTIDNCKFVKHAKFQYARSSHSVIPIPDDIVAKFCTL